MHVKKENLWLAIIAGGKGTRLFPISHTNCPKQFCLLNEETTFIQATVDRFVETDVETKNVVVITTNDVQTELAKEQLLARGIISSNIYQIDEYYNYAGAMVKAAEFINEYDKEAVIINTPADQFIGDNEAFTQTIEQALNTYDEDIPIIIGYKTTDVTTAIGCGHMLADENGYLVGDFIEKPSRDKAIQLIRDEKAACNTGINIWSAQKILSVISSSEISNSGLQTDELMNRFSHYGKIKVVTGKFDWHDCGTLQSLYEINLKNATPHHKNVTLGGGRNVVERYNCKNSLFYVPKGIELDAYNIEDAAVTINTIGDKIIVVVVKRTESQDVKQLAEKCTESLLGNSFTIKGNNNHLLPSNISKEELYVGFVGVNEHYVLVHKDRNGDIRVSVMRTAA